MFTHILIHISCAYTCMYTYVCARMRTHIRVYTYIHTYMRYFCKEVSCRNFSNLVFRSSLGEKGTTSQYISIIFVSFSRDSCKKEPITAKKIQREKDRRKNGKKFNLRGLKSRLYYQIHIDFNIY